EPARTDIQQSPPVARTRTRATRGRGFACGCTILCAGGGRNGPWCGGAAWRFGGGAAVFFADPKYAAATIATRSPTNANAASGPRTGSRRRGGSASGGGGTSGTRLAYS